MTKNMNFRRICTSNVRCSSGEMVSGATGGEFSLTGDFCDLAKDVSQYQVTLTRGYGDG